MSAIVSRFQETTCTIAISTTTSDAVAIAEFNKGSFHAPAALTGANFTVHVSNDGTNYNALQNAAGTAIAVIPATTNEANMLPAETFNFKFMKLVSASSEAAARTITIFLKG